jgi:hypothetical protein
MSKRLASCLILCAALAGPDVPATTVVQFSFGELCAAAPRIAHVVCLSSQPVATEDPVGVRTKVRFRTVEAVRGDRAAEFDISLPGGVLPDRQVSVPGMPHFAPGDEYVVFLSGSEGSRSAWPVGLQQGCYPVSAGGEGRKVSLRPGVTPVPPGVALKPAADGDYAVPLEDFLALVRKTVTPEPSAKP